MVEFDLSSLKKVKINEFKGKKLVDIRNYFEKDGEQKPTQKGISLTPEQWLKLLHNKDAISKELGIDPSIEFDDESGENEKDEKPERKRKKEALPQSSPEKKKKKLSSDTVDPEDLAQDVKDES